MDARSVSAAVESAARRCRPADVALSGGLDSSIVAWCVRDSDPVGYTLAVDRAPDMEFAKEAARHLGIRHVEVSADVRDALRAARRTVRVLRCFNDIEIRNMSAMHLLFEGAKKAGASALLTGDGADELFAGYRFLERARPGELAAQLRRLAAGMRFPAGRIAGALGMRACAPFMDPEVAGIAAKVPAGLHVRGGRGKAVLREAFGGALPASVLDRPKTPMQDGAGTAAIGGALEYEYNDAEFAAGGRAALAKGVRIRSRESLYYYEEFVRAGLRYERVADGCPDCGHAASGFCRMCGRFPL